MDLQGGNFGKNSNCCVKEINKKKTRSNLSLQMRLMYERVGNQRPPLLATTHLSDPVVRVSSFLSLSLSLSFSPSCGKSDSEIFLCHPMLNLQITRLTMKPRTPRILDFKQEKQVMSISSSDSDQTESNSYILPLAIIDHGCCCNSFKKEMVASKDFIFFPLMVITMVS